MQKGKQASDYFFIWHQTCKKSAQKTFVHGNVQITLHGVVYYYKNMEMKGNTTLIKESPQKRMITITAKNSNAVPQTK
jgi:hypothetical protein